MKADIGEIPTCHPGAMAPVPPGWRETLARNHVRTWGILTPPAPGEAEIS